MTKELGTRALEDIENSVRRGIWGAHDGCAVLAGIFLVEDDLIEEDAKNAVMKLLNVSNVSKNQIRNNKKFVSLADFRERLTSCLAVDAEEVRELGHDVIYSSYVLKALDSLSISPWESLLEGVVNLVSAIKESTPGWIAVNGENQSRELTKVDTSLPSAYWDAFTALDRPLQMEVGDMQLGHVLTHGHAIEMHKSYGSKESAIAFDVAYRKRLHGLLLANKEQTERAALPQRRLNPREADFWSHVSTNGDMDGHVFKYSYSFLDMNRNSLPSDALEAFSRVVWPDKSL
jgi:hypothetical protein